MGEREREKERERKREREREREGEGGRETTCLLVVVVSTYLVT